MHTVIWDDDRMLAAPVSEAARAFLLDTVEAMLEPIDAVGYREGPAVLLTTEARFAYVVADDGVYWVVQWPPGVVVVAFASDGRFRVARLPIEDDDHPLVDLVANPWGAQFDADERAEAGFTPADTGLQAAWQASMTPVQALGESLSAELGDEASIEAWRARASQSPWVRET